MKIMKSSPKNSCPSVGELDLELLELLLALRVGLWLRLSSGAGCASRGSRCARSARITATGFSGPGPSRALPGTDAGPSWARSRSMGSSQSMVRNATFNRIIQLVGGWPSPLKNDGVSNSWDDENPNIWKNKKWSKPPTRQYSTWFNRTQHCVTIWVRFWSIEPLILAHEKLMTWCYCWSITSMSIFVGKLFPLLVFLCGCFDLWNMHGVVSGCLCFLILRPDITSFWTSISRHTDLSQLSISVHLLGLMAARSRPCGGLTTPILGMVHQVHCNVFVLCGLKSGTRFCNLWVVKGVVGVDSCPLCKVQSHIYITIVTIGNLAPGRWWLGG